MMYQLIEAHGKKVWLPLQEGGPGSGIKGHHTNNPDENKTDLKSKLGEGVYNALTRKNITPEIPKPKIENLEVGLELEKKYPEFTKKLEKHIYSNMTTPDRSWKGKLEFLNKEDIPKEILDKQQEILKKEFPEGKMTVYRGFQGDADKAINMYKNGDNETPISFSDSWPDATEFSLMPPEGSESPPENANVLQMEIPIEKVLISHHLLPTFLSIRRENEVLIDKNVKGENVKLMEDTQ